MTVFSLVKSIVVLDTMVETKGDRSEVMEIGGVKLVSSVMIGDMGSIVFPAARCMVDWLVTEQENNPGWLAGKRVIGDHENP